jgi:AcrR family transcriptional regulator
MSRAAFHRAEPDVRRLDMIEATARVLARHGASGASVRTICAEAGVSPGLLRHYFDGVDALIAATYAHVGERVDNVLGKAMAVAGEDPRAQLRAYVTASFGPEIADRSLLATWLAFWSLVISDRTIARLHGDIYADYRRTIESLVAECAPRRDARLTAIAICGLVDGLWLELSLDPSVFTPEEACAIAEDYLDKLI